MASISRSLFLPLFFAFLLLGYPALAAHSPVSSPSLPSQSPADEISPSPSTPSSAPSPTPSFSSPPAPPPSDLAPNSPSPAPSPQGNDTADKKSPAPAPAVVGDISHENHPNAADLETKEKSSGGMNGGQKAGVAIGVIAGAFIVGAGALIYKKRQQNIQRSQYGYAARREIL
ncbi:hypothetical protein CDL12_00529 [Handroanthus impetiginosus]|uniref:Non-specific serine/threonine protein kinase n=1 Tax=Handroanthus impetiginosus TaxID=429701 RepID=A0A2G9IAE7_9LAMI|nr:hypothetical protein CDL12_00529 [Handroanthus impetiginosus]